AGSTSSVSAMTRQAGHPASGYPNDKALGALSCKTLGGQTMGTTWCVKLYDSGDHIKLETLEAVIQATLKRVTEQLSPWEPDSAISRLNRAEHGWYQLPDELYYVLSHALTLAQQTNGAYDPTLGALVDLWGF